MLQTLRRLLIMLFTLTMVICVILLLNFTAPNPTGRRYSSSIPQVSDGSSQSSVQAGKSGESILSTDLRIPLNSVGKDMQCLCGSNSSPSNCTCIVKSSAVEPNFVSIPDYITDAFIADSKNATTIRSRDRAQIEKFIYFAQEMNLPLWIFVRVDTKVDSNYLYLLPKIRETGGDIIPYFPYEGYLDPVDQTAGTVGYIALVGSVLLFMVEFRRTNQRRLPAPGPPSDKVGDAESYAQRMREKLHNRIDIEDSR